MRLLVIWFLLLAFRANCGVITATNTADNITLSWDAVVGASTYDVLRSTSLAWTMATTTPAYSQAAGTTNLAVTDCSGIVANDQCIVGSYGYEILGVTGTTNITIEPGLVSSASAGATVKWSGCVGSRDYSGYTTLTNTSATTYSEDPTDDIDYYYVVAAKDGGGAVIEYSEPIALKIDSGVLYADRAVVSAGGYVTYRARYAPDTPDLYDGKPATYLVQIQYDPEVPYVSGSGIVYGYTLISLDKQYDIRRVEFDEESSYTDTHSVTLRYDDGTTEDFDVTAATYVSDGNYRSYQLPVSKTTSRIWISITGIGVPNNYTRWRRVSAYTTNLTQYAYVPVSAKTNLSAVVSIPSYGFYPRIGTADWWTDYDNYDSGYQLAARTNFPFSSYCRITHGDWWPLEYCYEQIQIGTVNESLNTSDTTFDIDNAMAGIGGLSSDDRIAIGTELMKFSASTTNTLTVSNRGYEGSSPQSHSVGDPIIWYRNQGMLGRQQEVLPEFSYTVYTNSYVSGIANITAYPTVGVNDASRTASIASVQFQSGSYAVNDVIKIGREVFLVTSVTSNVTGPVLTLTRGYDGSNESGIQAYDRPKDVYKTSAHSLYYTNTFPVSPTNAANYDFENLRPSIERAISVGETPWFVCLAHAYACYPRGKVGAIESIETGSNNVLVDEYNSTNDDEDWWYTVPSGYSIDDDIPLSSSSQYEFERYHIHMLTGSAAGKVFYVRSSTDDSLRIVADSASIEKSDSTPTYVDLVSEGVAVGDLYRLIKAGDTTVNYGAPSKRYWQYVADYYYQFANWVIDEYGDQFGEPFVMEWYIEPDNSTYGRWSIESYVDSFNVFAGTIRTGGVHYASGFTTNQVRLAAGSLANGLRGQILGSHGEYGTVLYMLTNCVNDDILSYHRYVRGERWQGRDLAWEHDMVMRVADANGKSISLVNTEGNLTVNPSGGTSRGSDMDYQYYVKLCVPWWVAEFDSYFSGGDFGRNGQLDAFLHFKRFSGLSSAWGLSVGSGAATGDPVVDVAYWPMVSLNQRLFNPSIDVGRATVWADQYGLVRILPTSDSTNVYVNIANLHTVAVSLDLSGIGVTSLGTQVSVVAGGDSPSITNGWNSVTWAGADGVGVWRTNTSVQSSSIVVEAKSANTITFAKSSLPTGYSITVGTLTVDKIQ